MVPILVSTVKLCIVIIEAKCGVCVFRYWVLFLVCTVGVALMLPEVKVIKEVSKLPKRRGV